MFPPVLDAAVRRNIKLLYLGAGVLFGASITLGIVNTFMDEIGRGQLLAHFHAGSIGWITLGVTATAFWLFLGGRELTTSDATWTKILAWLGLLSVLGYIFAFALAFTDGDPYFVLLPIFGVPTGLMIIASLVFVGLQVPKQEVLSTPHVLLLCALIVASLGAIMGIVLGLSYASDFDPYPDNGAVDALGSHAGPMDMYLALAFGAIIEAGLVGTGKRRSWAGITQGVLGVTSAALVAVGLFMGIDPLAPGSLLLFLIAFGFYFARVGWRTFTRNPIGSPDGAGLFWSGLLFPAYVLLFVYLVFTYFIPGDAPPHWLEVTFVHTTFVGLGTTMLLVTQGSFNDHPKTDKLLTASIWLLVLGLIAFAGGEYVDGLKHGAYLMALGVVLGLITVWVRLAHGTHPTDIAQPTDSSEE